MKADRFAGFPMPDGRPQVKRYDQLKKFFELNKGLPPDEFSHKAEQMLATDPQEWEWFWQLQDLDPQYNPERRWWRRHRYPVLFSLLLLNVFLGFWQLDWISAFNFAAAGFIACTITILIMRERL